jgi:hypothetical protein
MKKICLIILFFYSTFCFSQDAKYTSINDAIQNSKNINLTDKIFLLDQNVNEVFAFEKYESQLPKNYKEDQVIFINIKGQLYKRNFSGNINVKWFGSKGDGKNDDVVSIQKAIDYLAAFEGGTLFIPKGIYKTSKAIEVRDPFISITGEGINVTVINCLADGIRLSPYKDVSSAKISELSIRGSNKASTIGLILNNSNFYFLEKLRISNFDIGIKGTTAVNNKIRDFFVGACRKGIVFENGSYFTAITDGIITGCSEIGIEEKGSRLMIQRVDIEQIGTLRNKGYAEGGIAIMCGASTEVRDCHIETTEIGFGLSGPGNVIIDNCYLGSGKYGVKQINNDVINGNYSFNNMRFVNFETDFYIPKVSIYNISEGCLAYTSQGMQKNLKIIAAKEFGIFKKLKYNTNRNYEIESNVNTILNNNVIN